MSAIEYRGARDAGEIAEAYELAARIFGPSYFEARESKDRILATEPPADSRDVVIAVRGGEVVGLVRLVDRHVRMGDARLKVGGITSVGIRPDMRGSGCGRAVMDAAIARSRERGDQLSIAYARRAVDGFYWNLGYVGLGAFVKSSYAVPAPAPGAADVTRGFDARHIDAYAGMYDATYAALPLAFARTAQWWSSLTSRAAWLRESSFLNVFANGSLAGYFVSDEGAVIEAAAHPRHVGDVANAIAAHAGGNVTLTMGPWHPVAAALASHNHTESIRRPWDGGHIVRALDRDAVTAALAPRMTAVERGAWRAVDLTDHASSRAALMASAQGSLQVPPVWSKLDEF